MSRHVLIPFNPAYEVVVGWDRPLCSFFAQVMNHDTDEESEERTVVWIGCTYAEARKPEMAVEAVRPFAVIPADLIGMLRAEREADQSVASSTRLSGRVAPLRDTANSGTTTDGVMGETRGEASEGSKGRGRPPAT